MVCDDAGNMLHVRCRQLRIHRQREDLPTDPFGDRQPVVARQFGVGRLAVYGHWVVNGGAAPLLFRLVLMNMFRLTSTRLC